jgi:hypothetical protein
MNLVLVMNHESGAVLVMNLVLVMNHESGVGNES